MKKKYITPEETVIEIKINQQILTGSTVTDDPANSNYEVY